MERLQASRFHMAMLGFFLAGLTAGTLYFMVGMSDASYLVSDGLNVGLHYLDKPRYDVNLQGFIFAISFLVAGGLLVLFIILPDKQQSSRMQYGMQGVPTPAAAPPPGPRPALAHDDVPDLMPRMGEDELASPPPGARGSSVVITTPEGEAADHGEEMITVGQDPARQEAGVERAMLADLPDVSDSNYTSGAAGDEDVVYGNGRVTEDSIWEFIQSFPDSAVKFLYRKSLDNKPLNPGDEDIYRHWESRGLTRPKVRQMVLELMGWDSLPDDFPHNIWREVRDRIYDMQTHHAA